MQNILIVGTDTIKRFTPIQQNVEDNLIIPYIVKVQDTHIQDKLGTDLYNKIISDIDNGTLSGDYATLVQKYIIPCLVEWTFYEVLPFINYKITNKSVVQGNSEFATETDLSEIQYLRSVSRDMAEFYTTMLVGYLREKSDLFPEYSTNSGLDKLKPTKRQNFFGGIYTGEGRAKDDTLGEGYIPLN